MRTIIACYKVDSRWNIPKGLKLLSEEENDDAEENTPFSWWIRWDTFFYIDENGEKQELEAEQTAHDYDYKYPDDIVEEEEVEEVEESDEEDEEVMDVE
jgi:hypothetical protein